MRFLVEEVAVCSEVVRFAEAASVGSGADLVTGRQVSAMDALNELSQDAGI